MKRIFCFVISLLLLSNYVLCESNAETNDIITIYYEDTQIIPKFVTVLTSEAAEMAFARDFYMVTADFCAGDYKYNFSVSKSGKSFYEQLNEQTDLQNPSRKGYLFDGWYAEPVGGIKITETTTLSSDLTIYAHWKEDSGIYTINYYTNDGTNALYKTFQANKITIIPIPKRRRYEFIGWAYYASDTKAAYIKKGDKIAGDRNFYAIWKKIAVKKAKIKKLKRASENKVSFVVTTKEKVAGIQIAFLQGSKKQKY